MGAAPLPPWARTAAALGLLGDDGIPAPSIFTQVARLAAEHDALSLGSGSPDFDVPEEVLAGGIEGIRSGFNQYGPGRGNPELIEAVCAQRKRDYGQRVTPAEVLITVGATEALASTLLAYAGPGDEVITFEPFYDQYAAVVGLCGATPVSVPLTPPSFRPNLQQLRDAITPRTRAIVLNSPHNPTGVVFSREEMTAIAEIANETGTLVITDEVYEHLTYDAAHVPLAACGIDPDLVVSISSAGKTFSVTGWKVGWVIATPRRVAEIEAVKQFTTFTGSVPLQVGITRGLALPTEWFEGLRESFRHKRDLLDAGLRCAGFETIPPASGYFILADTRPLGFADAAELARHMTEQTRVAAIPAQAFAKPDRTDLAPYLRFAFCKRDATLQTAIERLQALTPRQ